jgi:hypothetical protein
MRDAARARGALEEAGDTLSLTFLDANLGAVDMLRDRYADAATVFERTATRLSALRVHYGALNGWDAAAESRLLLLEPAAAAKIRPHLGDLASRVGDARLRVGAGLTSVEILEANGEAAAARSLLTALGDGLGEASLPATLKARGDAIAARLAMARGDCAAALVPARRAFDVLVEPDDARERERNWLTLANAELECGSAVDAAREARRIDAMRDASPTRAARLYASLVSAELARARGDATAAKVAFEAAQSDAAQGRVPLDIVMAADAYSGWLIETGDLGAASAVAERASPWAGQSYKASLLPVRLYHAARLASAWSAALDRARGLAGERRIPDEIATPPR